MTRRPFLTEPMKRIVSTSALPEGLSPAEIDAVVKERIAAGEDLYRLDRDAFAVNHPEAYAECMDFVPALARERHKKLYESCMRDAANRDESARVIRTTPQLNKAIDLMLKGEAFQIPGVPEFAQLAGGDNG